MLDLRSTIEPKSDQLNADDLVSGPLTIRVTKVSKSGTAEQPISIDYEGGTGRPYKPCKTMRRLLVELWGADGDAFAGRSMTLVRDPQVKFGGIEVGGIRITHLSDIKSDTLTSVTLTRGKRAPYKVQKLETNGAARGRAQKPPPVAKDVVSAIAGATNLTDVEKYHAAAMKHTHWTDEDKTAIDKARADMLDVLTPSID